MKNTPLKIGKIPYANLFPIFYYLEKKSDIESYEFTTGVPSKLNQMLREGELDLSPSSSIEYLNNRNRYYLLPWFSISSTGPIKSILLFSKVPVDKLGGETIALSSESDTSTTLLKVILSDFFSLECDFKPTDKKAVDEILSSHTAVLHIGDTAMTESKKIEAISSPPFIYDLGEIWEEKTGLPFVYALWVVRKDSLTEKGDLIKNLSEDLINAKRYTRDNFAEIASEAPQREWLSEKELIDYWKLISYDFTDSHMKGLMLFERLAKKLKG